MIGEIYCLTVDYCSGLWVVALSCDNCLYVKFEGQVSKMLHPIDRMLLKSLLLLWKTKLLMITAIVIGSEVGGCRNWRAKGGWDPCEEQGNWVEFYWHLLPQGSVQGSYGAIYSRLTYCMFSLSIRDFVRHGFVMLSNLSLMGSASVDYLARLVISASVETLYT